MRETPLSNCERNFINRAIAEDTRLDGRQLLEARPVEIHFGANWGCCHVALGETKAIAQVSCDIQQPKASRPNEGMLHINVEFNPIAAPHFEAGRQSEIAMQVNRQLEKCFKDSRCIDLESLCIVADEKVWNLRVDVNILNHDGNLVDCASIAILAALTHFHRPDVTTTGDSITIHSFAEKDPLPLTLHHYPVCVSFIVFESGQIVMDPTYMEERVGASQLTLGLNSYRELCSLQLCYLGKTSVTADVVPSISPHAANYANKLVMQIRNAAQQDVQAKYNKEDSDVCRLKECITFGKLTAMTTPKLSIKLAHWISGKSSPKSDMETSDFQDEDDNINTLGHGSAELITNMSKSVGEGGPNTWQASEESSDDEIEDIEVLQETKPEKKVLDAIDLGDDSEEEDTGTVSKNDIM
ncbi:exosome complex component RRP45 isoform X1 [Diprion similis]|uniref:exosome complex component RRP45 isoform X1 n=1 Tax=Diprion similis TaxID=362088 RepID=UPI001EF949D6|nr:exosome complex component RRP45 isoform X1 [Diprion similis]